MNQLVTNLYPRPNSTIAGENLSCSTSGSGVSFAAFDSDTKYVMIDVQDNKGLITLSFQAAAAAKFLGVSGTAIVHGSQFV